MLQMQVFQLLKAKKTGLLFARVSAKPRSPA